jgi:hypothetical protein
MHAGGRRRPRKAVPRVQRVPATRSRRFPWPSAGERTIPPPACDLLQLRADFPLRRIMRRLPAVTLVFSQKNPIVRCPTRGTLALFESGRKRSRAVHPREKTAYFPAEKRTCSRSYSGSYATLATISSGRCFFRHLAVIDSLLARCAVDLHIRWIRISKAGQQEPARDRGTTRIVWQLGPSIVYSID